MTIDTRQLRHFAAVAEALHFGRAAERLHITQPPLSQSIMALERTLGVPLIVRTRRSVRLTPFGEQWLPEVRAALAAASACFTAASHAAIASRGAPPAAFAMHSLVSSVSASGRLNCVFRSTSVGRVSAAWARPVSVVQARAARAAVRRRGEEAMA
jgi:DNA-binding transcriptional LysR family regulator